MSLLTDQHITILRALVTQARATNSDVGMDASVLAALLDEREAYRTALRTLVEALDADSETRRVLGASAGYVTYGLIVALKAAREVLGG
jgi:hypothetical protein